MILNQEIQSNLLEEMFHNFCDIGRAAWKRNLQVKKWKFIKITSDNEELKIHHIKFESDFSEIGGILNSDICYVRLMKIKN